MQHNPMKHLMRGNILVFLAFSIAVCAMVGSLYFSEMRYFFPCNLCWYQRILMYPLTLLILIGILRRDSLLFVYVLPFSGLGVLVAIYHYAVQWNFWATSGQFCGSGTCTVRYVEYFGFVTIPFLALVAFLLISLLMFAKLWLYVLKP